jgi:hypothetical protein
MFAPLPRRRSIGKTVGSDTKRYRFLNHIKVVNLGLRLADVEALNLQSENVSLKDSPQKIRDRLRRNGASPEEIDFLLGGRRVELNAMTSDQFIAFVEGTRLVTAVETEEGRRPEGSRLASRNRIIRAHQQRPAPARPLRHGQT